MRVSEFIESIIEENSNIKNQELYKYYETYCLNAENPIREESFRKACRRALSKRNGFENKNKDNKLGLRYKQYKEDGSIEVSFLDSKKYRTVEYAAEMSGISLDDFYPAEITTNRWNTSGSFTCWQFKVKWKPKYKKEDLKPKDAIKIFEKTLKKKYSFSIKSKKFDIKNGKTLEIAIPDLHFGQLSWGVETGRPDLGNYNIRIAQDEFRKAVYHFYSVYKDTDIQQIIFPLGNDLFNVNNSMNKTMNGTPQDEDERSKKTFEVVLETILESVAILKNICPNIDLIQIPGNHDEERIFYLMSALNGIYRNEKTIMVDKSPADRKYRLIGKTLVGFSHGKTKGKAIPLQNYPAIMADEVPQLWGKSLYREMHIGHIHHNKVINNTMIDEFRGTIVRVIPSLSQLDYWHYSSGYRGTRQAHVYEYDNLAGLTNICIYNA